MSPGTRSPSSTLELRWMADVHEQAHQCCLRLGDQIRSALCATDDGGPDEVANRLEELLLAIRRGESDGPVPALGRAYRRNWEQRHETAALLEQRLRSHPAWSWLQRVPGITPQLAARLLARLDVTRASTPSAFWAFCGLATVPAAAYRCSVCGFRGTYPDGRQVDLSHHRPGTEVPCPGRPEREEEGGREVRMAQPRPGRGQKPAYDRDSKAACYEIGTAFLRAGGPYEQHYRQECARLKETRPGWTEERRHFTALRKMEKLFLAHLWLVWREALGLPVTQPHARASEDGAAPAGPWQMVGAAPRRRWSRADGPVRARPSRP